jgi:hypothetical protein
MTQKLKDFQPESAGKRAAEAFRQEILDMQARGELPPDAQIVFEVPGQKPPPGRLN